MTLPNNIGYTFNAKVWRYNSPAAWYFVSLPKKISKEIRDLNQQWEEGWGRLKCTAKVGNSKWKTAIWFDTKKEAYVLPLKAEIRKKEKVKLNKRLTINVFI